MKTLLKVLACLRAVVMSIRAGFGSWLAPRAPAGQHNDPPSLSNDQLTRMLHALERDLAETRNELLRARAELESFSYAVSHDLRSPLRAIEGFSHVLLTRFAGELSPQGLDYLERVNKAGQRLDRMFDGLLSLSRINRQRLVLVELDFSAMAGEQVAALRQRDPGREVTVSIQGGVFARGDRELCMLLLQNLLQNAWKFTAHTPRARIEFGAGEEAESTLFWVRDNGPGFDMRHASRLFTPFQRLHPSSAFKGLGMGLAAAQRVVERHGGSIRCESVPGRGATFYFHLCSTAAAAADAARKPHRKT